MPRGARKGERRGGIKKGGHHKKTIARAIEHAAVIEQAIQTGRPLPTPKDTLAKFMVIYTGLAAKYQPPPGMALPKNRRELAGLAQFERWARLACETANRLAPYHHPTFRAVVIAPPPPGPGEGRQRFTLNVFENNKVIEHIAGEIAEAINDD